TDNYRAQFYSPSNPATFWSGTSTTGLRAAIDTSSIYPNGRSYLTFQNLTLQFCGCSPVNSNNANNNIIIRDCVIQWYGGGNISGQSTRDSRYGDGIDIEGSAQNWLVERNWFYQAYDVAVGPQCGGAHQDNITIRNNVFCQCGGGGSEFIFGPPYPTVSGLYIYNNTMLGAPGGWSSSPTVQRPNGAPNIYGLYPGVVVNNAGTIIIQTNMIVRNNIFAGV